VPRLSWGIPLPSHHGVSPGLACSADKTAGAKAAVTIPRRRTLREKSDLIVILLL
jgi:hypothetical protein